MVAWQGRPVIFDRLDAARTALVVIETQEFFTCPGLPLGMPAAHGIVLAIDRCADGAARGAGRLRGHFR